MRAIVVEKEADDKASGDVRALVVEGAWDVHADRSVTGHEKVKNGFIGWKVLPNSKCVCVCVCV